VLILPIVFIILYGSFELVKLMSIRQTLENATYQAARYLSVYHKYYADPSYNRAVDDRGQAERLIWQALELNPYIPKNGRVRLVVRYYNARGEQIPSTVEFNCTQIDNALHDPVGTNLVFTVRTTLTLPWKASVLELPLGDVTLSAAHTSFVDCGPWKQPPPPTPTPEP